MRLASGSICSALGPWAAMISAETLPSRASPTCEAKWEGVLSDGARQVKASEQSAVTLLLLVP